MPAEPDDEDTRRACTELAATLLRVADRLRTMPLARLRAPAAGGRTGDGGEGAQTVAEQALHVATLMADLGAGVEGRTQPTPPATRPVPRLADVALADQIEVTVRDLISAAAPLPGSALVWCGERRVPLRESLSTARAALDGLRRVL